MFGTAVDRGIAIARGRPASTRCWPDINAASTGLSATIASCWWLRSATLVGTIGLYIIVPKGFLPQQDTGVLIAVTEAAQSVSIPRLVSLQTQVAEIVERDPAVTGVVSFVGAGTINATPNTGRLTIALKPTGERDPVAVVMARMQQAIAGVPGITAFFQPVQDIQIGTRISRTQFQYTLMDTDPIELALWAPRLLQRLAAARS